MPSLLGPQFPLDVVELGVVEPVVGIGLVEPRGPRSLVQQPA
jgi:hypothetical protein